MMMKIRENRSVFPLRARHPTAIIDDAGDYFIFYNDDSYSADVRYFMR